MLLELNTSAFSSAEQMRAAYAQALDARGTEALEVEADCRPTFEPWFREACHSIKRAAKEDENIVFTCKKMKK